MECASFTQAARAVATGNYGAILPRLAQAMLKEKVEVIPLNKIDLVERELALAWYPRWLSTRPGLAKIRPVLVTKLKAALSGT